MNLLTEQTENLHTRPPAFFADALSTELTLTLTNLDKGDA